MSIREHTKKFAGLTVRDFGVGVDWCTLTDDEAAAEEGEEPAVKFLPLRSPEKSAYRISLEYDEADDGVAWEDKFKRLLAQKHADRIGGIVVGAWQPDDSGKSSADIVKVLVKAAPKLPNLRAILLGDITSEECEISWITQSDVGRLLKAYPRLQHLTVRGGAKLKFQVERHEHLKALIVQTGGLSRAVVHQVFQADLPALEHLELWLGTETYGADTTVEDIVPLLDGARFPKLKYLGLRDSEIADDIAGVLAGAPISGKIETLDLSLGALTDAGANALLSNRKALKKLKKLDVHHHFCSPAAVKQLKAAVKSVDAKQSQKPLEWGDGETRRFVSVSE